MSEDYRHPGEREAERLRIILSAFAEAQPTMTLNEALPTILAVEKRTAELEAPTVPAPARPSGKFLLPDTDPQTIASWIDLTPDIQTLLRDEKTIQAIKEVRSRCSAPGGPLGLKESKEGALHWRDTRMAIRATTAAPAAPPGRIPPHTIAAWIDEPGKGDIRSFLRDGKKILAIREVRHRYSPVLSLKEAKDGVEEWARIHP